MKKTALLIFATVLSSLLLIVTVHSQEDMVVISEDVFDNPQRPPAVLDTMSITKLPRLKNVTVAITSMKTVNWWKMNLPRTRVARTAMMKKVPAEDLA